MKEKSLGGVFLNGIVNENPTLRLVLGVCPTLASTTSAVNAVGMGAAATFVLVGSNLVISLLRKFIPDGVRIPSFIVVICTFVTIVEMLIKAFVPTLYESLGVFIPLIVVNCIILARAEAFASKNGPAFSFADGIGMGAGFTLAITVIAAIREIISAGTLFGFHILPEAFEPMQMIGMAPGGFITLGLVLGVANFLTSRAKKKKSLKGSAA
ncbi:MAG: Electron transport complex protein RnfE [Firmicutes bacterium ADurb.Bin182]|nr:MAG: Electron transport complex protein RnfE [Firmicutes bacterium ADurb.Bin182]